MKISHSADSKEQSLHDHNVLYKNAARIADELFQSLDFFDSRDLIQVKYEMVRRVQKNGWSVKRAASVFGFSRISYYKILHAIEILGLMGLMPKKRGPKQATKITNAVIAFIDERLEKTPGLSSPKLKNLLASELGVHVHKRTIERALQRKKKLQAKTPDETRKRS